MGKRQGIYETKGRCVDVLFCCFWRVAWLVFEPSPVGVGEGEADVDRYERVMFSLVL